MDPTYRLRTATRIHFLLLRRYGQDIDIGHLLKSKARNHDGLWLCKATGDIELISLARRLALANQLYAREEDRIREEALLNARAAAAANAAAAATGGTASQRMTWAGDTSGFGVSHPLELTPMHEAAATDVTSRGGRWLKPLKWLKAGSRQDRG